MKKFLFLLFLLFPSLSIAAPQGDLVNASTLTITSGGTWQALFAANNNRSTLWIQNPCTATSQGIVTAESIFVAFGTLPTVAPTTGGPFEMAACGSLVMSQEYVSRQAVWIYAATTSHAFAAAQTK
jgi:hypothetical protein